MGLRLQKWVFPVREKNILNNFWEPGLPFALWRINP
jgi:hypothetical protein